MRDPNEFRGREGHAPSHFAPRSISLKRCWDPLDNRVGSCAGNEDGAERDHADSDAIAYGRARADADDR